MKTIVLGYLDAKAQGPCKVLTKEGWVELNTNQADHIKLVSDAKATGILPPGLEHIVHCSVEPHTIALRWGNQPEPKTETKTEPVTKKKTQ